MEGWVEFENKGIAKHVALSLNNTPISMQKRNVHYGELWNLKYLHKFKWSHLTEKVAYERRVREQKLRVELMQAKRENATYTQLVETGKKLDKIEERKKKQSGKESVDLGQKKKRRPRQFKPMEEGTEKAAKKAVLSSLV
jgi:ESF2/ABP1 family protein